jgi:Pilus assembly protein, PilO
VTVATKKTKLPPQAAILFVAVGVLVFAALAFFLVVSPQRSQASDLGKQVEAKRQEVADARIQSAGRTKLAPIKIADLFRLARAMPDQTDMAGLLLQLNGVASDTGITFESITPMPISAQAGYTVVPIQVIFKGNFYNLADLLYRLRNLVGVDGGRLDATGRLFSVDTLEFNEAPEGFPAIQASLVIDAFVYGAGATSGPPAATTTTTSTTTATPASAPTASATGAP